MLASILKGCAFPALFLASALAWPEHSAARQPGSGSSRPVSLYVTVEKDGGLVSGLSRKNFRLYEDGEAREFQLQKPEAPVVLALLVEYSQSSWLYYGDLASAVQGFFNAAPDGHWYALATFANTLKVDVDFTRQTGKIPVAFANLDQPLWREVNTYDAVWEMIDKLDRLPGRRVLIFIGSGFDTFSANTLDDVIERVERANVTVYGAGAGSLLRGYYEPYLDTSARMNLMQADSFIRMLADKSGGEAWFPRFEAAFPDVMKGIVQSLAFQYRLVYEPRARNDGKFHKIKVEAFRLLDDVREDFRVRVREGWRR